MHASALRPASERRWRSGERGCGHFTGRAIQGSAKKTANAPAMPHISGWTSFAFRATKVCMTT